jgi:hypothetical protein
LDSAGRSNLRSVIMKSEKLPMGFIPAIPRRKFLSSGLRRKVI